MLIKSCPVLLKAVGDEQEGVFEAIVSVFGNKDSYGDVIIPGAFAESLAEWSAKGDPIPVYWSHRMDDPDYNIGHVLEGKELLPGDTALPERLRDLGGLWVKVQLDLDEDAKKSRQVYRLLKGRRVTQFSFAYDVLDAAWAKSEDLGEYFELRKLHIYEVGPTPIGANQETDLLAVKTAADAANHLAAGMKAGRTLSAKNESELRTAHESIGRVLNALEPDDQEKASGAAAAKTEEPTRAKVKEPSPAPSAKIPDAHELLSLELSVSI